MTLSEKCLMPFLLCFLETLLPVQFKASIQVFKFFKANMLALNTTIILTLADVTPNRYSFRSAYTVVTDDRLL